MKNLRESGFISVDERGFIALTSQGKAIAEAVYERHTILSEGQCYE